MENYVRKEVSIIGGVYYYNSKGDFHRTDGPAVIGPFRSKYWRLRNKIYSKSQHNRLVLFSVLESPRFV